MTEDKTNHEHEFAPSATLDGRIIEACQCGAYLRRDLPSKWQVHFLHRDGVILARPEAYAKADSLGLTVRVEA